MAAKKLIRCYDKNNPTKFKMDATKTRKTLHYMWRNLPNIRDKRSWRLFSATRVRFPSIEL